MTVCPMRDLNPFKFLLGMHLGDLWVGGGFVVIPQALSLPAHC